MAHARAARGRFGYTPGFGGGPDAAWNFDEDATLMTLTILYYVAITLHVVACFFLIGVVLLQQGKGQDLASAFGGGGTQAAFGPRGSANVLSRATTILAGVFMVTSLGLSLLRPQQRSVLDQLPAATTAPAPVASAPAATTAPAPAQQAPAPASTPAK